MESGEERRHDNDGRRRFGILIAGLLLALSSRVKSLLLLRLFIGIIPEPCPQNSPALSRSRSFLSDLSPLGCTSRTDAFSDVNIINDLVFVF